MSQTAVCQAVLNSYSCHKQLYPRLYWTATDVTNSCMSGCTIQLQMLQTAVCQAVLNSYRCHTAVCQPVTVTASWLICVCGFCLCSVGSWMSWMVSLWDEATLAPIQSCSVERAGQILSHGNSHDFTLANTFRSIVTEHITLFGFLLEGHTEIEHFLGPAFLWDCIHQACQTCGPLQAHLRPAQRIL
jgi:hypothetical protein